MCGLKLKVVEVLCLLVLICHGDAFPKTRPGYYYPRSYMLGGSFYTNPRFSREDNPTLGYIAPGQMTAMVVGDTVATNSYSGPPFIPSRAVIPQYNQASEDQQQTTERQVVEPDSINETEPENIPEIIEPIGNGAKGGVQETLFTIEEVTTEAALVPTTKTPIITTTKAPSGIRKIKVGKARRPASTTLAPPTEEEEEEEDDDSGVLSSWPFLGNGKKGAPAYNAFFPIFINGGSPSGRSRTGAQEQGIPGSATAIANSFSTGKGGVATSHATAFGDPYAAAVLRNSGLFNIKTKSNRKLPVEEIEE